VFCQKTCSQLCSQLEYRGITIIYMKAYVEHMKTSASYSLLIFMLILTIIVLPLPSFTINWQFLKNIQAFAQNIKLARTSGNLTQLISRSNQMSNNSKNNINISAALHEQQKEQQSPLSVIESMRGGERQENLTLRMLVSKPLVTCQGQSL
jgi:hypothetical protein